MFAESDAEENIRRLAKSFTGNDKDIAELYLGTKWGGYATSLDGTMNGGNGAAVITNVFESTIGSSSSEYRKARTTGSPEQ